MSADCSSSLPPVCVSLLSLPQREENLARLREEEERRKEVSTKFNVTLSEISNLMKENSDKNSKLRDENQDMATRLQDLIKQYESRESHVQKMVKQKELQCQLSEARMAKQQIEMTEDREKMLLEKKTLLEEVAAYQKKTQEMSLNEISLRTQLNSYMEKYEDFQKTLEKSNQIFHTFKKEMEEMAKKIKKTEKDTKSWKERWEGANKALLEMVTERSLLEKQLDLQVKQNKQLQNLCRALQQQLTEIRKQDKNNSEPECKDPDQISQEKCALVEDSTGKNINPLETEGFTIEETSLPVAVEVTLKPGKGIAKEIENDESKDICDVAKGIAREIENDESKDICDVAVAEDHVKIIEQTTEVKVNGDFMTEDHVEVMEQNTNVKVNEDAVTEDHVEVMEPNTEEKGIGEIDQKDRESEAVTYNMDDVD
ncbi:alpha-taxilin-like isoform X2 [Scylla paramamosain]|uniref:alpha-taxilin-like isoform X2 n=1 Tax=Scylla paramamosain TaxID=85552 RepID=UPI003083D67A